MFVYSQLKLVSREKLACTFIYTILLIIFICIHLFLQTRAMQARLSPFKRNLHRAVSQGYLPDILHIIHSGADVNMGDICGKTPLIVAAEKGYNHIIIALIDEGADANKGDNMGVTPLMNAAQNGAEDCLCTLLGLGADVNQQDTVGCTALHEACTYGRLTIIRALLKSGADVNVSTLYNWTPLMVTSHRGYVESTRLLLENGADVNTQRPDGSTAFTTAVINLRINCAKLLLRQGALINTMRAHQMRSFLRGLSGGDTITVTKRMSRLLLAAGQIMAGMKVNARFSKQKPKTLKNICRGTIRSHLLEINPYNHLFNRVPELGLPQPLIRYLLYHVSLDDEECSDDDGDDVFCSDDDFDIASKRYLVVGNEAILDHALTNLKYQVESSTIQS